jgi:hypothetical protein
MVHRSTPAEADVLSIELVAISAVGKALESLEDPEARLRVLRWANERYQLPSIDPSAVVAPAAVVPTVVAPVIVPAAPVLRHATAPEPEPPVLRLAPAPEQEPRVLRLATVPEEDFELEFEPQMGLATDLEFEPAVQSEPEPDMAIDSLEDLFDLDAPAGLLSAPIAEEGVMMGETEDLSDLYEPPTDTVDEQPMDLYDEFPDEPARPQLHLVSREDQPFGQAIDDFVENLRKLTDECLDD